MRAGRWYVVLGCCGAAVACHDDPRFTTLHMTEPPPASALAPAITREATLANGLRVAIQRDPRAPLVTLDLRYEVGAADDPVDHPGLAVVAAHALVHAASRDRGSGAAPDVALTTTVAVDLDRTELTTLAVDGDVRAAVELEARRLETTCADFEPSAVTRAANEAAALPLGAPPGLAALVFGPQHPYAHPIGVPNPSAPTPEALCAWFRDRYTPAAATLVVTGPVDDALLATIRARFERIPRGQLVARTPVGAIEPTRTRLQVPLLGLAKPAALLAFPLLGAPEPDDIDVALAIRRLESNPGVHAYVMGGERVRALAVVMSAKDVGALDSAHERLAQAVEQAGTLLETEDDEARDTNEVLTAAGRGDDVLARGAAIAARLARGLPPYEPDASGGAVKRWCAAHLVLASARRLDLLSRLIDGVPALELDALAQEPAVTDANLAVGDPSALITPILRAPQPVDELVLPNGLRVVLAPDPHTPIVDLRLVMPVGERHASHPQVAARGAQQLTSFDGPPGHESVALVEWYAKQPVRTSVDVTDTTTQFHRTGLSNAMDWHVFALAWLVTEGHYPSDLSRDERAQLEAFREHAYRPAGATLIVTGNFDAPSVRTSVTRWFGPWSSPATAAKLVPRPAQRRTLVQARDPGDPGALRAKVIVRPAAAATTTAARAARMVVAALVQQRVSAVVGEHAEVTVTYRARSDEALTITVQTDPALGGMVGALVDRELSAIQRELTATADELSRARRVTIAQALAASVGPVGRGAQLAQAVELGAPFDEADREIDALRTIPGDDIRAAATALLAPP